jgi:hypothetical protein
MESQEVILSTELVDDMCGFFLSGVKTELTCHCLFHLLLKPPGSACFEVVTGKNHSLPSEGEWPLGKPQMSQSYS